MFSLHTKDTDGKLLITTKANITGMYIVSLHGWEKAAKRILIMLLIHNFLPRTYKQSGEKSKCTLPYLKTSMKKIVAVTTSSEELNSLMGQISENS